MQPRPISLRGLRPSRVSWLCGLPLLAALLVLGAAAPAHATDTTISSPWTGSVPIFVNSGDTLTITDGGSVSNSSGPAIGVVGGTVNISGGSVSASAYDGIQVISGTVTISGGSVTGGDAVFLKGGTANISGGSLTGLNGAGVLLFGGTANISGGSLSGDKGIHNVGGTASISGSSISGSLYGVEFDSGTLSISGSCLQLSSTGVLTGTLADGIPIDTPTYGLSASNLVSTPCPDTSAPTTTATATADGSLYTAGTWSNTKTGVIVSLKATDPDGTSDVSKITYSASGARTIASTDAAGAMATLPTITAEGSTTVSFHATDKAGNVESNKTFTVQIDTTAPKTTATPSGMTGNNGWYTGTVSVTLAASDANGGLPVSGVKQTLCNLDSGGFQDYPASGIQISGDRIHTLAFYSLDGAGNIEGQNTLTVKIDKTPPVVSYSGNAGTYTVDQTVNITCSATDNLSGVASSTCQNITGPAYAFNLGLNTFSATATDYAGNTGRGSTSFTVQDTPGGVGHLVTQWVTDPAVLQGLHDKLNSIATAIAQGNTTAQAGVVGAFINQVQAQTGKSITAAHAALLIQWVSGL